MTKDIIIAQLLRQNEQQAEQIRLLTEENQKLRERIARLEKNSSNSSKPPSSDITNPKLPNAKKKKRKIGGQKGHPKHPRPLFAPDEIDKTVIHKLSAKEVRRRGLIPLQQTELALQQIDLLPYHRYGVGKYENLGLDYPLGELAEHSEEQIEEMRAQLSAYGIPVLVGG